MQKIKPFLFLVGNRFVFLEGVRNNIEVAKETINLKTLWNKSEAINFLKPFLGSNKRKEMKEKIAKSPKLESELDRISLALGRLIDLSKGINGKESNYFYEEMLKKYGEDTPHIFRSNIETINILIDDFNQLAGNQYLKNIDN